MPVNIFLILIMNLFVFVAQIFTYTSVYCIAFIIIQSQSKCNLLLVFDQLSFLYFNVCLFYM